MQEHRRLPFGSNALDQPPETPSSSHRCAVVVRREIAETVFQPTVGGHIYDRGTDGSECRWARILAYRQTIGVRLGHRPIWQVKSDPEHTSEVEGTVTAESAYRTRVELEHRHIDRHGPRWEPVRDGVGHDQGWPLYLDRHEGLVR